MSQGETLVKRQCTITFIEERKDHSFLPREIQLYPLSNEKGAFIQVLKNRYPLASKQEFDFIVQSFGCTQFLIGMINRLVTIRPFKLCFQCGNFAHCLFCLYYITMFGKCRACCFKGLRNTEHLKRIHPVDGTIINPGDDLKCDNVSQIEPLKSTSCDKKHVHCSQNAVAMGCYACGRVVGWCHYQLDIFVMIAILQLNTLRTAKIEQITSDILEDSTISTLSVITSHDLDSAKTIPYASVFEDARLSSRRSLELFQQLIANKYRFY